MAIMDQLEKMQIDLAELRSQREEDRRTLDHHRVLLDQLARTSAFADSVGSKAGSRETGPFDNRKLGLKPTCNPVAQCLLRMGDS